MTGESQVRAVRQVPTIRRLSTVVDGLVGAVSASRLRQLRMTVGQLERAVAAGLMPRGSKSRLDVLLGARGVDVFLEAAAAGRLRDDPTRGELSWSSLGTLRDCLKILGDATGTEVVLPRVFRPGRAAVVSAPARAALYRRLADLAAEGPLSRDGMSLRAEDRTRLLAMVGVVLDTAARAGELAAMRLEDLGEGEATLTVRRRPQNASHLPEVVEVFPLREGTRVALRRWFVVRDGLVARSGQRHALWVALVPKGPLPPGVPLLARGVERAFARGATALNVVMAGEWGWEPLPTRLELLRRSVEPG